MQDKGNQTMKDLKTKQNRQAAISIIEQSGAKWKSSFITRDEIPGFTGGAFSAGHLANLDSQGLGPEGAFKVGRRQCYGIDSLIAWLIDRLEVAQ